MGPEGFRRRKETMALKARLKAEEHAKLSDTLKAEYTKGEDGTFTLAVDEVEGFRLENTESLRSTLGKERARADTAEAKLKESLKPFEGLDAAKARDALKRLEAIDAGEPDDKTKRQIESLKAQLADKHRGEIEPLQKQLKDYESEIDALTVDRSLAEAMASVQLLPSASELLIAHVKSKGLVRRVKGPDGRSTVRVFGEDGVEMVTREAGKTGSATVHELVGVELKKRFPALFVESKKSGGGADPDAKRTSNEPTNNLLGVGRLANALASSS